jgi:hypothetical protein
MAISKDLKERARKTREHGVFTLKLDEGVSLAMLVSFAQDMFPGVSTEDIGVWPADDGELVVSVRGGGTVASNYSKRKCPGATNEVRLFVGLNLRRRPGSFQPLPPMFATWSPEPGEDSTNPHEGSLSHCSSPTISGAYPSSPIAARAPLRRR